MAEAIVEGFHVLEVGGFSVAELGVVWFGFWISRRVWNVNLEFWTRVSKNWTDCCNVLQKIDSR